MEKRSSDPRVAYPEVKVQVRDVVLSPLPNGGRYPGKIRFIEPQGVNGHRRAVPGAPSSGTPWESKVKFRDGAVWGLCRRVLWVPDPQGQYLGIIRFIEKPGVEDEGDAMWLNVVLNNPLVAYCDVWVLSLCPTGVGTRGKFVLSRHRG